jgi:general secretion pathway protein E
MASNVFSYLCQSAQLPEAEVKKAQIFQQRNGGRLEHILVRMGVLSSEKLPALYAELYGLPLLAEVSELVLSAETRDWLNRLPKLQLQNLLNLGFVPFNVVAETKLLSVACKDPGNIEGVELLLALAAGLQTELWVCREVDFDALVAKINSADALDTGPQIELSSLEEDRLRELASEAPIVNLLNNLIARGLRQRASDMHIEPFQGHGRVRYRIDGVLHDAETISYSALVPVITRLKLLSRMDIAEKRRPQDGKISMKVDGFDVDIRVSALPVGHGESIVMRFLLQGALSYDIKTLGIEPDVEQALLHDINSTTGVVLLTGPTGSGKTTTLYSFLTKRNAPEVKIITIEDPIEYQLDGINQVQVHADIGYTFANALRSVVRQDPDIIMIGEIRDLETAGIALQSSLTGHLVFSTLHTNDAPSAYTRLIDLGIEPFLLSASVKSIVAQRLVRKLCPDCATEDPAAAERLKLFRADWLAERFALTPNFKKPVGCAKCSHTGYIGRVAIIEYMPCDNDIKALIGQSNFVQAAAEVNRAAGRRNLLEDGFVKAIKGITTIDEVLRVAG